MRNSLQKRTWAEVSLDNISHNYRAIRAALPEGCRFADRCEYACERCRKEMPQLQELENGHTVRCFLAQGVET